VLFVNSEILMAITPYPWFNDSLENPCLYKSKDGLGFVEYSKGLNPIVPTPKIDHNCDPDILFDKDSNLVLYYLETLRPFANNIVSLTKKKNSEKFTRKTVVHFDLKKKEHLVLSPAVAKSNLDNLYYMYFVDINEKRNSIKFIHSSNLQKFDKNAMQLNSIIFPKDYSPWHLDIITSEGKYYLLTNGFHGEESNHNYSLFIAESTDLIHWTNNREILNAKNIPDPNLKYVYRSSGLIFDNTLALWYSYINKYDEWKLAFKKLDLKEKI
jgi:predicted GH43/DUF377 family glycosyl hydrolase